MSLRQRILVLARSLALILRTILDVFLKVKNNNDRSSYLVQ